MSYLLVLLIANAFLFILTYLLIKHKFLSKFILFVFSSFLTLTVIEIVYRTLMKNETYDAGDLAKDFFKPDSLLGYTINKPGTFNAIKKNRNDTIFNKYYSILP